MHRETLKRTLDAINIHEAEEFAHQSDGFITYEPSQEILDDLARMRDSGYESQATDALIHIALQAIGLDDCTDIERLIKIDQILSNEMQEASFIEQEAIRLRRKQLWLWANQLLHHEAVQKSLESLPTDTKPSERIDAIIEASVAFSPLDLSELDYRSLEEAIAQHRALLSSPDESIREQNHATPRKI